MSDAGVDPAKTIATRNVVLTAVIAGLSGLLFGDDTGIIVSALLFIRSEFDLGNFEQGWS